MCACLHILWHIWMWAWTDGMETSSSWAMNRGGWYPSEHLNGEIPVTELIIELWEHSIQGRSLLLDAGLWEVMHCRAAPRYWIAFSICRFVCRW